MKALKILIADDSPRNLELLRAGLESEGHRVIEAANGAEVLAILERETPDAVISDVLMPLMDGFRLCREIRTSAKSYSGIPVILYTAAHGSPSDRELADTVGADGYILKPAPAAVLIGAVQDLLRKPAVRNADAQQALARLQAEHERVVELNRRLESRVMQRTAALDAANKELEAFSFSVSHDLRAPLRRISGFAHLLGESASAQLDDDHRKLLDQVIGATTQMNRLIDALLEFARISRIEMHCANVELDILIDRAIADLRADLADRTIEWRRSALPAVHGDAILLHQMLASLLSNAVKYTRTRDPAVIDIGAREGRPNEVVVHVRDNGVGFDPRYAGRLFGAFQRMHGAHEFEGIGIGLAKAQRIVTRHGGTIWAEAAPGSGATFYFSLPRS